MLPPWRNFSLNKGIFQFFPIFPLNLQNQSKIVATAYLVLSFTVILLFLGGFFSRAFQRHVVLFLPWYPGWLKHTLDTSSSTLYPPVFSSTARVQFLSESITSPSLMGCPFLVQDRKRISSDAGPCEHFKMAVLPRVTKASSTATLLPLLSLPVTVETGRIREYSR